MRLSIVVPASRDAPTLPQCLAAIHAAADPADEVIVVEAAGHGSPAAARNEGATQASGDVLVFIDADVAAHPAALPRIRAAFAEDPQLDAVFGCYDDQPAARDHVSHFRNLLHHHVHTQSQGTAHTFWTGLGAITREAFLANGGFNADRYPRPMIEDIELGRRVIAAGGRIELRANIQGTHLKTWTLGTMLLTDLTSRGVPWMRLILEQRRAPATLNLAWRQRLSALTFVGLITMPLAGPRLGRARGLGGAGALFVGALALNHGLYALLLRRGGPRLWVTGVLLHGAHQLICVMAVPIAVAAHILDAGRRRAGRRRAPWPFAGKWRAVA